MKRLSFLFLLTLIISVQFASARKFHLYIGTYTEGDSKGIYHYIFDNETGNLEFIDTTGEIKNPSFLKISPNKKYLYSVAEDNTYHGVKGGGIAAFKIERGGSLTKINDALSLGAYPCHITISPDNKKIIASNYGGGSLAFYNIIEGGGISPMNQLIQHQGKGADPVRQAAPHTHSAQFDKSGKHLFTADLGIDKFLIYKFNDDSLLFHPAKQPFIKMESGAGPRHFAFTRKQDFIYVINELNSTVSVLKKSKENIQKIQDISTLPSDYEGASNCADIHLSKNERFVYGSNRGHNSIVIYSRDKKTGHLSYIENQSVKGDWPRNFSIDPSGKFLLVANKKSNNITVFSLDKKTGKLTFTGVDIAVPNPVCIEFRDSRCPLGF